MKRYKDFILDKIINESVLYFSPRLKKYLVKLSNDGCKISSKLLDTHGVDIKPDITFLDIDSEGRVSYTTMDKIKKMLNEYEYNTIESRLNKSNIDLANDIWKYFNEHPSDHSYAKIYGKNRVKIKIGRLAARILDGVSASELEDFTNRYKALQERQAEKFKIVEGDDISYWYSYRNYKELVGTLGNSCMRSVDDYFFDIYTNNPGICRMLILVEDDKLLGRSLIWKVEGQPFEYFMDRQYAIADNMVHKFRNYAKDMGWAYKERNSHTELKSVNWKWDGTNWSVERINMEIKLNNCEFSAYPYMDTFKLLDINKGILYNESESTKKGYYILASTEGEFERTGFVWSEMLDQQIDRETAVYSGYESSWIPECDSVSVTRGTYTGYFYEGSDYLVYDNVYEDYIHEESAVWSKYHDSYILNSSAYLIMEVFDSFDIEGDYVYSDKYKDRTIIKIPIDTHWITFLYYYNNLKTRNCYIIKDITIADDFGNLIPKSLLVDGAYTRDDDNDLILTDLDCYIFSIDKPRKNPVDIDIINYVKRNDKLIYSFIRRGQSNFIDSPFSEKVLSDRIEKLKKIYNNM